MLLLCLLLICTNTERLSGLYWTSSAIAATFTQAMAMIYMIHICISSHLICISDISNLKLQCIVLNVKAHTHTHTRSDVQSSLAALVTLLTGLKSYSFSM